MKNNKKITIYDIARISGVSPKTVSRVINGGERVKPETYQAVMKVIDELSYVPNAYAQNLTKKETINILISVKKMESFPLIWFQTLLDKVLQTCKEVGVNAIVEYFGEADTDGVIYVSNNDFKAGYDLMEAVGEKGFKKMWLLMGGPSLVNKNRENGVREFVKEKRYDIDLEVIYGLFTIESVYDYVKEHLSTSNIPDIIFVSGDEKVQGVIRGCYEKGILIPDQLTIVGFDNIPIAKYYTPALSTIAPNYTELAKEMIEGVLAIINGEQRESVEVSTSLIRRQTF